MAAAEAGGGGSPKGLKFTVWFVDDENIHRRLGRRSSSFGDDCAKPTASSKPIDALNYLILTNH